MTRYLATTAVLCGLLATVAFGQVKLENKPRYEPGRKSVTTSRIKTQQVLDIGKGLESQNEQYMELAEVPGDLAADGTRPVKHWFEQLKISMTSPGVKLQFDSADPDKLHELPQLDRILGMFRRLAKAKWTVTLGPDQLIKSKQYEGEPFAGLDDELKQEVDTGKDVQTANDVLRRLPDKLVEPKETWKRTERFDPGGGQMIEFERELQYLGPKQVDGRTLHEMAVKTTGVKYLSLGENAPLKVAGSDLKVKSSSGTILYDATIGRMTHSIEKVQITGEITFVVSGQPVTGKLDLTLESETVFKR